MYLERPKTDVEYEEGQISNIRYGVGEMQGWRLNMVRLLALFNLCALSFRKMLTFQLPTLRQTSICSECSMAMADKKSLNLLSRITHRF